MMMKKLFLLLAGLFFIGLLQAQVGINTVTPQSSLHIKESNAISPGSSDGILVPTISDFPATGPNEDGNLVYLRKISEGSVTSKPDGFYYWKDGEWLLITTRVTATYIYNNIYCVYGQGYENQANVPNNDYRKILFTDLVYNVNEELPADVFSISNNELTVGKTGLYMASLVTGTRKDGENLSTQQNSNTVGEILVNGASCTLAGTSLTAKATGSSSVEAITASQLTLNVLLHLNKGDKISARVRMEDVRDGSGALSAIQAKYTNTDISTLTLKYLYNL